MSFNWRNMENRLIGQGRGNAPKGSLPVLLAVVAAISLLTIFMGASVEGVQHQVGGAPGWSLPSISNVNYTLWADSQTFKVGDVLYFNYSSAYHNVMEVTKTQYDSCDASSPTLKWADGADYIPLKSSGTFYYICGITGHCAAGQKVAVTVVETTHNGTQHQVGGVPGWSLPSRSNVNYTTWASTQTFLVGDTLYFNYSSAFHDVVEVTASEYVQCDGSNPIAKWDDGATIFLLNTTGTFYFICDKPGHCAAGQKVAVTVEMPNAAAEMGLAPAPSPGTGGAASSSALSLYRQCCSHAMGGVMALSLLIILACPY